MTKYTYIYSCIIVIQIKVSIFVCIILLLNIFNKIKSFNFSYLLNSRILARNSILPFFHWVSNLACQIMSIWQDVQVQNIMSFLVLYFVGRWFILSVCTIAGTATRKRLLKALLPSLGLVDRLEFSQLAYPYCSSCLR